VIFSSKSSAIAPDLKGRRIDGKGKYLIPGLMDVHIHLRGGFDVSGKVDAELAPPNHEEGVAALGVTAAIRSPPTAIVISGCGACVPSIRVTCSITQLSALAAVKDMRCAIAHATKIKPGLI
jgi:adenine deaminase